MEKSFRAAGPTWSAQSCVNLVADLIGGGSEMTALVTDATRARRATGLEPRRRSAGLAWIDRTQAFIWGEFWIVFRSARGAEGVKSA